MKSNCKPILHIQRWLAAREAVLGTSIFLLHSLFLCVCVSVCGLLQSLDNECLKYQTEKIYVWFSILNIQKHTRLFGVLGIC